MMGRQIPAADSIQESLGENGNTVGVGVISRVEDWTRFVGL
jgi:hypothetical protein